jgi:protein-S-isoprenylcysteine O-methyltransferase Ste14
MNSTFAYIASVMVSACVVVLFVSIVVDFILYQDKKGTKREERSMIATGSMIGFYVVYYVILELNTGKFSRPTDGILKVQVLIGVLAVITGTVINIAGRMQLKGNWANHIKIYEDHSLITNGMYSYVRHPLYSSIILMLYGGAVIYSSWLATVLVTAVFIPAMVYRAKQEEELLSKEFPEYEKYQQQVGLFFPKHLRRGYKHEGI